MPALSGKLEPRTCAEDAAIAIRQAEAAGRITDSYIDARVGTSAMANSAGLFGAHAENGNRVSLTRRSYNTLS